MFHCFQKVYAAVKNRLNSQVHKNSKIIKKLTANKQLCTQFEDMTRNKRRKMLPNCGKLSIIVSRMPLTAWRYFLSERYR